MADPVRLSSYNDYLLLQAVQKSVCHALFTEAWSPSVPPKERSNIFRDYLGVQIQDDEEVPIVGVGISGTEEDPVLEFLSTTANADVEMLLRRLKMPAVPCQVTRCSFPKASLRPAKGGDEIGHPLGNTGTLGCLVENDSGEPFILSCNHVIASLNDGKRHVDETWEPGRNGKRIGILHDFKEITFGVSGSNVIDAAISKPDPAQDVEKGIRSLGAIHGRRDSTPLQTAVHKYGKTTKATDGRVFLKDLSVIIGFENKKIARFEGQLGITSTQDGVFAVGGDSGSIIVDDGNNVVGLLFATAQPHGLTFANPISEVLNYFRVNLCHG